jgi:hypothetical protein
MKATSAGPIIGKALEGYSNSGADKILVFVETGWYAPSISENNTSANLDLDFLNLSSLETDLLIVGGNKISLAENGSLKIDGNVQIDGDLLVAGNIKGESLSLGSETSGSAILTKGKTGVFVSSNQVTAESRILVTANTLSEKNLTVTSKVSGKGFTVEITSPEVQDISFDWLVIN